VNAAPRSTIPKSRTTSGTKSAIDTAANAGGKPENITTTTRISQTWFASQIGPIASSMSARASFLRAPRRRRSQIPPPKSAPPSSA
jgi:hypothetical protein